ncbi:hypothetical protein CC117_17150 [Parafrankia colletiae]|uniref:Uncharacterized protein n=1 Tax=Parafrankia colletiae TaxID=573497 RepID=A0A1S1QT47_9ACTN|nr:hypothetical protein [Parafrankia colletiae]MCK9904135.1 hypothetical protein [Frankia sp. Cpl3]OHV36897.1 hypothetical protein CC117_17150 [Parafrankia colletiae]
MPRDEQHRADAMLRGLVGGGRSRLSLSAAMRARDVSRLAEEDLAWAEETVVLRHAHPAQPASEPAAEEQPQPPREPPTAPLSRPGRRRADARAGRSRRGAPRPGGQDPDRGGQDADVDGDTPGSSPERS